METKSEKFIRIAEPRVTRVCNNIKLLGNLASSSYECTQEQVDSMFAAIEAELSNVRAAFTKSKKKTAFKF